MHTTILRWLGMSLLLAAPGCNPFVPAFGWPNLRHPGGFAYQRWKAEIWDPYPATEVGPTPYGMRPVGYETPAPAAQRLYETSINRFGPAPPEQSTVMP